MIKNKIFITIFMLLFPLSAFSQNASDSTSLDSDEILNKNFNQEETDHRIGIKDTKENFNKIAEIPDDGNNSGNPGTPNNGPTGGKWVKQIVPWSTKATGGGCGPTGGCAPSSYSLYCNGKYKRGLGRSSSPNSKAPCGYQQVYIKK